MIRNHATILIFLISVFGSYKTHANCFDEIKPQIDSILDLGYDQAHLKFFEINLEEDNAHKKACISYYHGRLCYSNDQAQIAVNIWKSAFHVYANAASPDNLLLHKLIYNCGIAQLNENQFYAAIKNFKYALKYVSDDVNLSKCYVKIATCYREAGEYTLSNYYNTLALKSSNSTIDKSNKWISKAYGQMAVNFNEIEEPDSAIKYAKLQIEAAVNLSPKVQHFTEMYSYTIQGNAYETKGNFLKYIEYSNKVLQHAKKSDNKIYEFKSLSNIGYAYNKLNQKDKSLHYLNKAKQVALDLDEPIRIADAINTIGDVYYQSKNYRKSTQYYLDALNYLPNNQPDYNYNHYPTLYAVQHLDYLNDIFNYTKFIALSMVAEAKTNDSKDIMRSALNYIHFADSLLFELNENILDNTSKFHWREQANELYSIGIEASNYIKDQEEVFYFIERGKYFVLRGLLEENIRLSKLSPAIQGKHQVLKEQISKLEIKHSISTINQNELAQLINLKEQYQDLKDTLKSINKSDLPGLNNISLSALQQRFLDSKDHLYISYLETKKNSYGFYVSKDSSWLKVIPHTSVYIESKNRFIDQIIKPLNTTGELNSYLQTSKDLYDFLTTNEISGFNNIIINPSGTLNFIPFDALCTDVSQQKIVLFDQTIRYTLSPSIELQNRKVNETEKSSVLLIAPIEFKNHDINNLTDSEFEVKGIHKITGGKKLLKNKANKTAFIEHIDQFSSLHLATHSMANNEANHLPWIAFYDEKMYLPEIYNLSLKDKFVVLSACETFRGDIISGEGIMNLVWGIHYAGSKSVVATLWNTYDKASKEIMLNFYKALKQGASKETALRNAKLAYIDQHGLKPDQWAPFIYIGESSTIKYQKNKVNFIYLMLAIAIIALSLFSVYRMKTKV